MILQAIDTCPLQVLLNKGQIVSIKSEESIRPTESYRFRVSSDFELVCLNWIVGRNGIQYYVRATSFRLILPRTQHIRRLFFLPELIILKLFRMFE